jgi:phage gp36-like protein
MAYIDKTYILSKSNATDVNGILDGNGIDDSKLIDIIADAEALVNRKLSKRYLVPIPEPTNDLKRFVLDIVLYYIYSIVNTTDEIEAIRKRYDETIKTLDKIADGNESLSNQEEKSDTISKNMVTSITRAKLNTEERLGMM